MLDLRLGGRIEQMLGAVDRQSLELRPATGHVDPRRSVNDHVSAIAQRSHALASFEVTADRCRPERAEQGVTLVTARQRLDCPAPFDKHPDHHLTDEARAASDRHVHAPLLM